MNPFKTNASTWSLGDLQGLRISYDDNETDLLILLSKLTYSTDQLALSNLVILPEYKPVKIGTEQVLGRFEFDFTNMNLRDGRQAALQVFRRLRRCQRHRNSQEDTEDRREQLSMFDRWNSNLQDFTTYFVDLLNRGEQINGSQQLTHEQQRFSHLFNLFSRTCLLRPEPGRTFKVSMTMKEGSVSGYPDARFVAHSSQNTIAITTVRNAVDLNKGAHPRTPQISRYIPDSALGQHGIGLLLEKQRSFFNSGVAGFICIGTKVIFTFLEIGDNQYTSIQTDGFSGTEERGTIFYTKYYDFMKPVDRKEILESFLKIAKLQSQY